MSTEAECIDSVSDAVDGSNTSRFEVGHDQMSESLADPLSGLDQELTANGDDQEGNESLAPADDHGVEKRNGFTDLKTHTESVNGGLGLRIGTQNLGGETNESHKKVPVANEEVLIVKSENDSDGIETELRVEKEVEPDMVCSMSGRKVENLDESDMDDNNAPVTAKLKIADSDLVWAKVRSHPWWPGQVFDASAATDKAKKYFKKGNFLVIYSGDCTFAWNDASRIKPFRQHFSQMAKQSSIPDFVDAIDFALEEVARRVEFGLACSCISEEVYQKIKTQNIINPGIREDSSSVHGGDKVSSAVFFEPANLVEYVKRLACSPTYDATDGLQLVIQRAQLLAFSHWKGYTDLPEFDTLQGSIESAPKTSPAEEKSSLVKVSDREPKKSKQISPLGLGSLWGNCV